MTKKRFLFPILFVAIFLLAFGITLFLPSTQVSADIELLDNNTTIKINGDSNFEWRIQAKSRTTNQSISARKIDGAELLNGSEEVDNYYAYDWKTIGLLNFIISPRYDATKIAVSNTSIYCSFVGIGDGSQQTENSTPFYTTTNSNTINLTYKIDPTEKADSSSDGYYGYGFGIYRFEVKYIYTFTDQDSVEQVPQGPFTKSVGVIYIAILPDKAEDMDAVTFEIEVDSVTSSEELLNVYNMKLVSDEFNYLDPGCVVWSVMGHDLNNRTYVLCESDKAASSDENSLVLWPTYAFKDRSGLTFRFDSNNIQGVFDIICTIYNSDGTEKMTATCEVSTIKSPSFDWTWLWILLLILLIGAISIFILIFVVKKKKKKN